MYRALFSYVLLIQWHIVIKHPASKYQLYVIPRHSIYFDDLVLHAPCEVYCLHLDLVHCAIYGFHKYYH